MIFSGKSILELDLIPIGKSCKRFQKFIDHNSGSECNNRSEVGNEMSFNNFFLIRVSTNELISN